MEPAASTWSRSEGWRYGLLGLPLAFVALPLYVILPNHYAREFGVPLAWLGAVLLGARLLDALIDPVIGRLSDSLFARSARAVLVFGGLACGVLALGFALLFFPPMRDVSGLLLWSSVMLMMTYAAFSAISVAHQSWGAMLGGGALAQSRIVAWREGLGLLGVVLASVTPALLGMPFTVGLFWLMLGLGWLAWSRARQPRSLALPGSSRTVPPLGLPFMRPAFRRLLAVFVVNGIASAVPATLVLFFVQDRLQAPQALEPVFLGTFFLCAALSMPLWLLLVRRIGLARAWLCGMLLAVAVFIWASQLGAGQVLAFGIISALSGLALGADLGLPAALLAGVIADAGDQGQAEGRYFGWWNFATKLNLALAAGVVLPLLAFFGYAPGARDAQALQALTLTYCLLPCALKLMAASMLYTLVIRREAVHT